MRRSAIEQIMADTDAEEPLAELRHAVVGRRAGPCRRARTRQLAPEQEALEDGRFWLR